MRSLHHYRLTVTTTRDGIGLLAAEQSESAIDNLPRGSGSGQYDVTFIKD